MLSKDVDSLYKTKIFWRGSSGEGHIRLLMSIFGYRHLKGPHKIQTHSAHRKDLYLCVCLSFSPNYIFSIGCVCNKLENGTKLLVNTVVTAKQNSP